MSKLSNISKLSLCNMYTSMEIYMFSILYLGPLCKRGLRAGQKVAGRAKS